MRPYPRRIEVLGADSGYVTDYRYVCNDTTFFREIYEFEKKHLGKNSTGKIAIKHIEIWLYLIIFGHCVILCQYIFRN